jgi:hypothetical protein
MSHDENQPRARRWSVTLAVAVGIALLTAACGGGGTAADPGASAKPNANKAQAQALAFSQCMRSHGVPKFPDPTINGNAIGIGIGMNSLGVSQSVMQAAMQACRKLIPGGGPPANSPQDIAADVKFAQCMRSHGEPGFPDPNGNGVFVLNGIDPSSSAFQAAQKACKSVTPPQMNIQSNNPSS